MQRVAIARALVNDPEIILADEPTGALDSKTSIQIMDLLKEIASDKLVIMVTHNPDLAKEYSTRIIELKDGVIIHDTNPFKRKDKTTKEKSISRTSMSLLSALSLSFNNLLTKKGRTVLTALAGSIGIIGIALILSLSNGVNNYAKKLEKDSLSDYPITLERVNYDLFGTIAVAFEEANATNTCKKNQLCSKDDIVKQSVISSDKGLVQRNNLKEFKKYIEDNKELLQYASHIYYGYQLDLQVYTKDYLKVNPSEVKQETSNVFEELNINTGNYKVVAGKLPEKYDEVVLIIGRDNTIDDSLLYSLNIKDRKELQHDLEAISKDEKYKVDSSTYRYDDILNREYKLILNTDYYKEENGIYIDNSNNVTYMKEKIDNGTDIKIVGIVKDEGAVSNTIGYSHDLTLYIINEISKSSIYQKQMAHKNINVLTGEEFNNLSNTYEDLVKTLGVYEESDPSTISIYPKDYDSKQKITDLIDKYNNDNIKNKKDDLVVKYSDVMKSIVGGVTKVVNIVSCILIAFVAISLIVSSIMIAIITYISVLERTKEIGILRAIGASKRDIKRVFRAETIIEGLVAGCLGVGIAILITVPINLIVYAGAEIENIAILPISSAIILILLSVFLNVLAGNRPSKMAAKKDPVEALRTE